MSGEGAVAGGGRWVGLDALRGLSILAMILVNNPGRWSADWQFAPLRHAAWHGCTFTDLVFPTFLFCAGVAIVPALSKRVEHGAARGPLMRGIAARVAKLILFGWLLSTFPLVSFAELPDDAFTSQWFAALFAPVLRVRLPGVLQRIAVCYGVAALLFLFTSARTQRGMLWASLLLYWPLITLVPVPGVGTPDISAAATTLQGYVDQAVFGSHIYVKGSYDPEGLLSTIPAVATCLFGVEAGRLLRGGGAPDAVLAALLRRGALLMVLGAVWGWMLPMNKPLWTSSYAVWTAGIATAGLGLCVWAFEHRGMHRLAHPLRVYGTNALLVFVGSGLLGRAIGRLITVESDGGTVSLKSFLFRAVFEPVAPPKVASLLFALAWVAGWYALLRILYRRGIVWRV